MALAVQYAQIHNLHRMKDLDQTVPCTPGCITCFCCSSLETLTAIMCFILCQLSWSVDCSSILLQKLSQMRAFSTCARAPSAYIFALWGKAVPGMSFPSSPVQLCWYVCLSSCCHAMGYNILLSFYVCSLLPKRDWNLIKYKEGGWKLE